VRTTEWQENGPFVVGAVGEIDCDESAFQTHRISVGVGRPASMTHQTGRCLWPPHVEHPLTPGHGPIGAVKPSSIVDIACQSVADDDY